MGRKGGIGGAAKRRGRVTGGKKQKKDMSGAIGSFLSQLAQRGGRQRQALPIPAGGRQSQPVSRQGGALRSLFGMGR